MTDSPAQNSRSYGCTFGCGNPYDFVIVSVVDGTTELLCVPCFIRMAADMVQAVTEAETPEIRAALADIAAAEQAPMQGRGARPRGRNAPATTTDLDVVESFDAIITVDDLPEDFR